MGGGHCPQGAHVLGAGTQQTTQLKEVKIKILIIPVQRIKQIIS